MSLVSIHCSDCMCAWPLQKEQGDGSGIGRTVGLEPAPPSSCLLLCKEMYLCTLYISHFSPSKRIEPPAICCLSFGKSLGVSWGQEARHSYHRFPALSDGEEKGCPDLSSICS